MKAIIFAAGKGSRLRPLTELTPKPLIEVNGKAILDHIIESLPRDINEIILITEHLEEKIKEHISTHAYPQKISTISQGEKKGTMGALLSAKDQIAPGERFLVLSGDDLHDDEELAEYLKYPRSMGVHKKIMPNYLATEWNEESILTGFRKQTEEEKQTGAYIATGVYLLDDQVFSFPMVEIAGGEYGLPQTLIAQASTYPLHVVVTKKWHPINSHEDLEKAHQHLSTK